MEIDGESHPRDVPQRTGHVCVYYNKYMIVWGGYATKNISSNEEVYLPPADIWLYNTEVGYWLKKETTGQCPPGTSGASACLFDHCMYIFAGHTKNGNVNTLYKLDLHTLEWGSVEVALDSDLPSPRDKCVCWVHQNRLYFFGGFCVPLDNYLKVNGEFHADIMGLRGWNNQLLVFDLETKMWSNPKCKMSLGFALTSMTEGEGYGGSRESAMQTAVLPNMIPLVGQVPSSRAAHAAAKAGNKVFLFGGRHQTERLNDLHCLYLDSLTWTGPLVVAGNVPTGRSWHTFTLVSERQIFLYGGFDQWNNSLTSLYFANLCSVNNPATTELFGDELSQAVRDISETNKLSHSVSKYAYGNIKGASRFTNKGKAGWPRPYHYKPYDRPHNSYGGPGGGNYRQQSYGQYGGQPNHPKMGKPKNYKKGQERK